MTDETKIDQTTAAPSHKSIYAAIAAAVGGVRQLGKSERNKFDGYDFVSIDKFLALVNPICATHGLFPSINLTSTEMYENTSSKGNKSTWARFRYDISLHHAGGETFGPVNTMVAVPMNGAQASGSAQSYALKQFFRGMFMIPTGDKDDADLNATEQHHNAAPKPPKPAPHQPDEAEIAKGIIEAVNEARGDKAELTRLWGNYKSVMAGMSDDNFDAVKKAFEAAAPKGDTKTTDTAAMNQQQVPNAADDAISHDEIPF